MAIKIDLIKNGPIKLSAEGEPFPVISMENGKSIESEGPAFLCRCGASENKPYCDGSHEKVGYTEENRCQNDALKAYEGKGMTVFFNRSICSGAAKCVGHLPSVFKSEGDDWIHPDGASVEAVIKTVKMCPSGALTYSLEGTTHLTQKSKVAINIVKNGPYEVAGAVEFAAPKWSQNASQTNFALCRCGKSANNPFCDYSHGEQGWKDQD